jgi:hypothetical protein
VALECIDTMAKQDSIRAKLENKVFNVIGKKVTFISKVSPTYDVRGEITAYGTDSTSETEIVPYNIISDSQTYEAFGAVNTGDMDAAVRYSLSIKLDDIFVIDSTRYLIKNIQPNYLPDNVVSIVRLVKEQA